MAAPVNWQDGLSTIQERTEYAFNNALLCDFTFSVVDKDGIISILHASKYLLAIASPVFEIMFYGDGGKVFGVPEQLHIEGISKSGLEQFLLYLHTDKVHLDTENVMDVLNLAQHYMVSELIDECKKFMKRKLIKPETVFAVLPEIEDEELKLHCWDIIDMRTLQSISSSAFLDISSDLLRQVLCRDSLRVKEVSLFQAVERWAVKRAEEQGLANNSETKRRILRDVIRLVRFPLMSQKEFAGTVLPTGLLDLQEVTEVVQRRTKSIAAATAFFSNNQR